MFIFNFHNSVLHNKKVIVNSWVICFTCNCIDEQCVINVFLYTKTWLLNPAKRDALSPDISQLRDVYLQDAHLDSYDQMCDPACGSTQGRSCTYATASP
jgi:hypothetical protein